MDYTYTSNHISTWISLTKGKYYIELYHCQGKGHDWFNWGVEVKEGGSRRNLFSAKMGLITIILQILNRLPLNLLIAPYPQLTRSSLKQKTL